MKGMLKYELFDGDGRLIDSAILINTVTTEGKNHILATEFRGGAQQASWFIGIMNNAGWSGNPITDTMAAHSGWAEFVSYSQTTRPQWSPNAPSGGIIANTTQMVFNITADATLKGFFVVSNSAKSGTSGILWSTVVFADGLKAVLNGQEFRLTYTYTLN